MSTDYDEAEFQLRCDIQAQKDPEGAEHRRKQHERQRKWRGRQRKINDAVDDIYKVILWVVGAVATAAIGYLVKVWLSKYVT